MKPTHNSNHAITWLNKDLYKKYSRCNLSTCHWFCLLGAGSLEGDYRRKRQSEGRTSGTIGDSVTLIFSWRNRPSIRISSILAKKLLWQKQSMGIKTNDKAVTVQERIPVREPLLLDSCQLAWTVFSSYMCMYVTYIRASWKVVTKRWYAKWRQQEELFRQALWTHLKPGDNQSALGLFTTTRNPSGKQMEFTVWTIFHCA